MEKQPSPYGKKGIIIEELVRGREFTNQLLALVRHHGSNNNIGDEESLLITHPFAEDLVKNILRSFTNILMLLNTNIYDSHEIPIRDSSSTLDACPKSEGQDLDESCKSLSTRNRRGCYKRKRNTQIWEKDSPILVEDGHAWRKYGQKMTRNANYLRNYYRCSHKYDQGCPAMKQVQRVQEKPPLYRTIYYGLHTCNNNHMITFDPSPPCDSSSILLSFNNTNSTLPNPAKQEPNPFVSSSSTKKEEHIEEDWIPDDHGDDVEQNLVSQYEHVTVLSPTLDPISSVKDESYKVDDVILRFLDFDELVRFGL